MSLIFLYLGIVVVSVSITFVIAWFKRRYREDGKDGWK